MTITSFRFRELSTNTAILSVASTAMPWEREKVEEIRSRKSSSTLVKVDWQEEKSAEEKLLPIVIRKTEAYEKSDSFNH